MEKINLPKSTKKIHYQIFKGISIFDLGILLIFIGLAMVFILIININIYGKFISAFSFLSMGFILIQKCPNGVAGYEIIFRGIKYFFKKGKTLNFDLKPIFELTNLEQITKYTYQGKSLYMSGVKIQSTNLELLNENQQANLMADFADLLRTITIPCKIIKTNENFNFDLQIDNLKLQYTKEKNIIYNNLIDLQIDQMQKLANAKTLTTSVVYVVFCTENKENTLSQLQSINNSSSFTNLNITSLTQINLLNLWKQFSFGFENFKTNAINIKAEKDNGFIWAINDLPTQINYFWLNKLFNLTNINVCVNLFPIDKQQAKKQLDNAINKIQTNEIYDQNPSQKTEAQQYFDAFSYQQQAVIDDVDVLKDISIFIIAIGNKNTLAICKRELNDLGNINGWKYDKLLFLQKKGLAASYSWKNKISKATEIEMTCDTFATSFPIPDMPLNDEKGFLLAETITGKPIIFNLFKINNQRINHNLLILGESGSGKSFTTKKIILNQAYKKNCKIFILDPEREFTNLTNNLHGQIINGSGAKGNIINPLEIIKLDLDHDNADTFNNHLALLEAFFIMLFPNLNDDDIVMTLLIDCIKEVYFKKNILPSSNFELLKPNNFPTFNDLYNLIITKIENEKNTTHILKLENLKSKLTALTQGTYAKYWNGTTKFQWKEAPIVSFDLRELFENSNSKIINLQMMLILRMLGQELSAVQSYNQNKNEQDWKRIIIAVDEAHLLASENNTVALDFLFHTMKRIRKCKSSLIIATQNIADFTGSENVKKKFTGIINNVQYTLVGGMQPNDLNNLNDMYKQSGGLSDAIKNYIAKASQGKFWFKISKQEHLPIQVLQIDDEIAIVGST